MAATSGKANIRAVTDTDRRHLLAESVCPSEASSVLDIELDDGQRTPQAQSPVSAARESQPQQQSQDIATGLTQQDYKGFPSKAHYLAALHAWADSKRYTDSADTTLPNYYGKTTMEEYAQRPRIELGITNWKRQRKERRDAKQSSAT